MDKRLPLAAALIILVLFGVPLLFPRPPLPPPAIGADSAAKTPAPDAAVTHAVPVAPQNPARVAEAAPVVRADTVVAHTAVSTTWFSNIGAAPLAIQADSYPAL